MHIENAESDQRRKPINVDSYSAYVGALVGQLHINADINLLYSESAMDLEPWLHAIEIAENATPVDASFPIGLGTKQMIHLHSDDVLPEKALDSQYGPKLLAAYALAEAKLRYLDKNFENLPALRGFKLQTAMADIHSETTFYLKHRYWKNHQRSYTKIRAVAALSVSVFGCSILRLISDSAIPNSEGSGVTSAAWLWELQTQLGDGYEVKDESLWYTDPNGVSRPVVVGGIFEGTGAFSDGPDMDWSGQNSNLKERDHYIDMGSFWVGDDGLLYSKEKDDSIYAFNVESGLWTEIP